MAVRFLGWRIAVAGLAVWMLAAGPPATASRVPMLAPLDSPQNQARPPQEPADPTVKRVRYATVALDGLPVQRQTPDLAAVSATSIRLDLFDDVSVIS